MNITQSTQEQNNFRCSRLSLRDLRLTCRVKSRGPGLHKLYLFTVVKLNMAQHESVNITYRPKRKSNISAILYLNMPLPLFTTNRQGRGKKRTSENESRTFTTLQHSYYRKKDGVRRDCSGVHVSCCLNRTCCWYQRENSDLFTFTIVTSHVQVM